MGWLDDSKTYAITTLNSESLQALDGYTDDEGEPLLASVIGMYLEGTPKELAKLADAVRDKNQPLVHHISHALKSTSANLGALHLASLCEQVEDLSDPELHQTMVDCSTFLSKIQREFSRVQRDMRVIQLLVKGQVVPPELRQG